MTIRKTALFIIFATTMLLFFFLYGVSETVLHGSFADLEEHTVIQNVERAQLALSSDIDQLNLTLYDWAAWNDTYSFIADRNQNYITTNLPPSALTNLRLNLMLFLNSSGQIVLGRILNLDAKKELPVSQSFLKSLFYKGSLVCRNESDIFKGIVLLPEGPLLISSQPILTSEGKGPVRGTLIMGRYLDSELARLNETTNLPIVIHRINYSFMPSDFAIVQPSILGEKPITVKPLSEDSIAGYNLIRDVYGDPALILRINMLRDIYHQGKTTIDYFALCILLIGLTFAIIIVILLDKAFLSKITRLSQNVCNIKLSEDISMRVPIAGDDEISSLSDKINNMLYRIEQSITERKRIENELRQSKERFKAQYHNSPIPTFTWQKQGADFILIDFNKAAKDITNEKVVKFAGCRASDLYTNRQEILKDIHKCHDEGVVIKKELISQNFAPGRLIITTFGPIPPDLVLVQIEDITERKLAENALKESESRLADIINFLPDATLVIDINGKVIAWNHAIEEMTGIKAQDILGKGAYEYALPFYGERKPILIDLALEPQPNIERNYSELRWVDSTIMGYAFTPNLRGVGSYLWVVASPIYDTHGKIVGAIESIRDVTEQRRMEKALQESKDYLYKIINSIADPIFVKDRQHRFVLVNDALCIMTGHTSEEYIGKTDYDFFPKKQVDVFLQKDELVFETEKENVNEEQITDAKGIIHTIITKKTLYKDNADNMFIVGIIRDITDRKQAEDRIIASLKEKEVLLKEVHHRVKNNLGIISALLSLQSSYLTDEDLKKIFRDCQNRVKSMALVHESLYRSKDFDKIYFNEYINQLGGYISQSYGDLAGKIKIKVNSENVYLNINTAIPCGMIINELVSNSFKHAFPDRMDGEICIDLSSEDDCFRLIVSDNGIGIKEDINIKESKTLGFRLIDTLVKQIDGDMRFDTINGFKCEIYFKGLK